MNFPVDKGFGLNRKVVEMPNRVSQQNAITVENWKDDFRNSGIPDRLIELNASWVDGEYAVRILTEEAIAQVQKVKSYVSEPAKKILRRYQFAASGGWVAYGTTLDGQPGNVPCFKPAKPRQNWEDKKAIKYETPAKMAAVPLLPCVDDETAEFIYQKFDAKPSEGESFWQTVQRCNLPIVVTEGVKKALALIAQGYPAIALRGVTCWHVKGSRTLHQQIADFATKGREIYIAFDQDEKPKTNRDVSLQATKLGNELESKNCLVKILNWDTSEGKGIDDALVGKGNEASKWLNGLIESALSLKVYRSDFRNANLLRLIADLNKLSIEPEQLTEGEYLYQLPELEIGAIHVVDAAMNAGKTTRIGRDWVKSDAVLNEMFTLVLSPLNALGRQTAANWGLPHIHECGNRPQDIGAFWKRVKESRGLVLCPDSLGKLPNWIWAEKLLLILDEANQVCEHIVEGGTLGDKWTTIVELFYRACQNAAATGAIVLSEYGIPNRCVELIQNLSGSESVRLFQHKKQSAPWECTIFEGSPQGYRKQLLDSTTPDKKRFIVVSSQLDGEVTARALTALDRKVTFISGKNSHEYVSFFRDPDQWLQENKPDDLIITPSGRSGLSIEGNIPVENAYFQEVWGCFLNLDTATHMQMLGRYRPPVPRFIYTPAFVRSSGDEALLWSSAIRKRFKTNQKQISGIYGLSDLIDCTDAEKAQTMAQIENAVLDYLADSRSVRGAQKSIISLALIDRLQSSGHIVKTQKSETDKAIGEYWKELRRAVWREDSQLMADQSVLPGYHTPEWAYETLNSNDAGYEDRLLARKVLLREQFPGIEFDDENECFEIVFNEYGEMRRGVLLQAQAENLEAVKESDRHGVEAIFKKSIRPLHKLPKNFIRAGIFAETGILDLLKEESYNSNSPKAIDIKKRCLRYADEIQYWLGLYVADTQTPVEIINKLLKKLGLKAKCIDRKGKRDENRARNYAVNADNPFRLQLLEAARRKLSGSVSTISNIADSPIENHGHTPIKDDGDGLPWHLKDLERLDSDMREQLMSAWRSAETPEEREFVTEYVNQVLQEVAA